LTDVVWAAMQNCWEGPPDARPSCAEIVHRLGGLVADATPSLGNDLDEKEVYLSGVYEIANIKARIFFRDCTQGG